MSTQPSTRPQAHEVEASDATKLQEAGSPYNPVKCNTVATRYKARERLIEAKAVRVVAGKYGIGDRELLALCVVECYLYVHGHTKASREKIVDFSGYRAAWRRMIGRRLNECIQLGVIEEIKSHPGKAIQITHKGHQVLRGYEDIFEQIEADWEDRKIRKPHDGYKGFKRKPKEI